MLSIRRLFDRHFAKLGTCTELLRGLHGCQDCSFLFLTGPFPFRPLPESDKESQREEAYLSDHALLLPNRSARATRPVSVFQAFGLPGIQGL